MDSIKKIKSLKIWKHLLLYILKPIYQFVWEYIINVEGKLLYFFWFRKNKQNYFNLNNEDQLIVNNEEKFYKLASDIKLACDNEILKKSKDDIKKRSTNQNLTNSGENSYKNNINYLLSEDIKKKIFSFACSEKIISTAAKHLKVFPVLNRIEVYHNLPIKPENIRGAMMWHRDDFGYRSLDLFIAVSNIDDDNGPLYAIKKIEKLGVFSKISNTIENPVAGERGKIKDQNFKTYLSDMGKIVFKGNTGSGLFIDSFTVYHKGGHCTKNERLMLRFSYTTPDAINLDDNIEERKFYDEKNIKMNIEKKFINFLLHKDKIFFHKLISKKLLLLIYSALHYKLN